MKGEWENIQLEARIDVGGIISGSGSFPTHPFLPIFPQIIVYAHWALVAAIILRFSFFPIQAIHNSLSKDVNREKVNNQHSSGKMQGK